MSIKGTKTEKNLCYYASQASKEGYEQIAAVP